MGLERIKQDIDAKALSVEKELLGEAEQQVKELQKKTAQQAKEIEAEAQKRLNAEIALLKNRELSLANMEAQRKLFAARTQELEDVYKESEQRIKEMPASDRENIVKRMFKKAKSEIDVARVYGSRQDCAFVEGIEKKVMEVGGYIICETKDGRVRVDYTLPTLFNRIKERTLAEVSKKLFQQDGISN